jgi:hypothetical protein
VFDNKMWVIAGVDSTGARNDVWYSTDGIMWIQSTGNAGFSPRDRHSSLVFDNKMWVIGGLVNDWIGSCAHDVWNSTDGVTWTQVTTNAGFSPRYGHSGIVFDNRMWVIAGLDSSSTDRSDAWYSTDGITWIQATSSAGFSPRVDHSSVVFNNKMWVIGGYGDLQVLPDVWYSPR